MRNFVALLLALALVVCVTYLIIKGRAEWDAFERNEADDRLRRMLNRNRL